jgi:hypothetical protein
MTRLDKFYALKNHPMLGRSYKRLTLDEIAICVKFINETEHLNINEYAHLVVRLFLDKPKPKHWTYIEELLMAAI